MNLSKLFDMQRELDAKIIKEKGLEDMDRLPYLILALQVEIAECANSWRGFKFWSNNREPKPDLLEEYCDGLHFFLSIGNHIGYNVENAQYLHEHNKEIFKSYDGIIDQFNNVLASISLFRNQIEEFELYEDIGLHFIGLGEMLGFTWEQIEQAYISKNAVNHERQVDGY